MKPGLSTHIGRIFDPFCSSSLRQLHCAFWAWLLLITIQITGCTAPSLKYFHRTPSYGLPDTADSSLSRLFKAPSENHPGQSGLKILDKGEQALLWRGALTDTAEKSIDAQYYIWHDDNVGTIAAQRLLQAADRGVRVRVLLDDFPLNTDPYYLAHLDAHPNIHIRVYNPLGAPYGVKQIRPLSLLRDFKGLNRRMHNKVFVADGTVAIVGGRNIGDEYYDMHEEFNFRDMDVLVAGTVVEDVNKSFDAYWNSDWSVPIAPLLGVESTPIERERYFHEIRDYTARPENFPLRFHEALAAMQARLSELPSEMIWAKSALIYDIPGKNDDPHRIDAFGVTGQELTQVALETQKEIIAESPYLFMMPGTFEVMDTLLGRGVRIRMLTNSLAATDMVGIFAPYSKQRLEILRRGIELYESKPRPASQRQIIERYDRMDPNAYLSLHAKTAVFDRKVSFIGSFNLDPRSIHLNTEIGLIVYSDVFAERLADIIEKDLSFENCYQLDLDANDKVVWRTLENGKNVTKTNEPEAGIGRKIKLFWYSFIPYNEYF
jgi:putative cardiolipin synthase